MRLSIFLFLVAGICMTFTSCNSDPELPVCIQDKLDAFEIDNSVCTTDLSSTGVGGNLVSFRFRGDLVYCFNWGACNRAKTIEIWTESCELLCEMGGLNEATSCDGVPWEGNATEVENLYQK